MTTNRSVPWDWRMIVALLGVLGLVLAGCPEQGDDDDDDSADDDDDASDDDAGDDDAGDDDAQGDGSGTWEVSEASNCGDIQSVVVFETVGRAFDGIFASSEPLTCAAWLEAEGEMDAAWAIWDAALKKATSAQDGAAACAAATAYYTTLEQWDSSIWPSGSCTLEMHTDSLDPGEYIAMYDKSRGYAMVWGVLYVVHESYFAPHVALLTKECPGVSSWGDWGTVESELWYIGGESEFWDLYDGSVTLASGDDLQVTSTGMQIQEWNLMDDASIDFDLMARMCSN